MSWPVPVTPAPSQQYEYPALGFVPCPGDPATAGHVARQVRQTTTALSDVVSLLRGSGNSQWRGRSAEAWREQWEDDFTPKVEAAHESFRVAANALEEWADHMPQAQREASQLEEQAHAAQARIDGLPTPASLAEILGAEEGEEREEAIERSQRAQADLERAAADLDAIRQQARALEQDYLERGNGIADRLGHAMDIAPNKPGWLSSLGDCLGGIIESVASAALDVLQDIGSWVAENAARIAAIGDLLAVMSTLSGVLSMGLYGAAALMAWAPPVALALAGAGASADLVSTGFALGALTVHGVAWLGGADVSGRTFSQDLFGAIPLVGNIRNGGRVAQAIGDSVVANGLSFGGLMDSIVGTVEDPTALTYLMPTDGRQAGQMFLPGGPLLVGFENAWRQGGEE